MLSDHPRIVVCTCNLWRDTCWPGREAALRTFLRATQPDILAVQELLPVTRRVLDEELKDHQRVEDAFPGWEYESNLYWNRSFFSMLEYGAQDIGIVEAQRRLFWVKLTLNGIHDKRLLCATAHFTCCNLDDEKTSGHNPRLEQASRCASELKRLSSPTLPIIFMGDLNEDEHPFWRFTTAGFSEVCHALSRSPQVTSPALPRPGKMPAVDDWMYYRGDIRPITIEVVHSCYDSMPPSDHYPVLATFCL